MSYHHLSTYERGCIETLQKLGYTSRNIAQQVGRHHSAIAREIKRNNAGIYDARIAQQAYSLRRKSCISKGKYNEAIAVLIEEKLSATWSPEQIANTIMFKEVSFKTIYNWIYDGKLHKGDLSILRRKGKRSKSIENRGKFVIGKSISQRDQEVDTRKTFGHWELDTMVSSRGESKGCFATFVERKSRLYTALKIPNRSAVSMENAIHQLYSSLPKGAIISATSDRGKEFACYKNIEEELQFPMYFADAYCPWQRGSNENSNGLLREFYPKKTDLAKVDQKEIVKNLFLINNRPRKCLAWKSPIQVFLHEVSHLT